MIVNGQSNALEFVGYESKMQIIKASRKTVNRSILVTGQYILKVTRQNVSFWNSETWTEKMKAKVLIEVSSNVK